jgi:signal transduction histidine kinase
VWSDKIATAEFTILPAFYQTLWFRSLCVILFLAMAAGLYQLRLHQISRLFNVRLEERVAERTRIARDLHDTLLQSFQGLLLHFQTAYALFDTRPADAKRVLASSIDQTAQAITEGREAVQGLRASTVESNDLAQAITTLGEQLAAEASSATSVGLHVEVEGTPRNLHPIVRDEIYRIAGEALRNAFRHAESQKIEVEFRYDERELRLRVRDDGKGIDATFLTAEGRTGHFGLDGMRERAKLMGGKLTVWTAALSGTEIEIIIPAARAYAASPRRSWFAEKFSGTSEENKS